MKQPLLLLVLCLFHSASGELRQPLVDICRSRTNDDVSFRLCVARCGGMSPTNQNSGPSADVNSVEGLFRQFGKDGGLETEGGSAYEVVPECLLDPEGDGSSPHGSGDTAEEQDRARRQREGDEKDDESGSFVDFEKTSEFGDLEKRLTAAFVRANQQDLPNASVVRHHVISAEEEGPESMHTDNQERNLFPASPSPKIAKIREGSSLQIVTGQTKPVTEEEEGSKENSNAPWNSVDHQTDDISGQSSRPMDTADSNSGEGDANGLDLKPFGDVERTGNSFAGVGESPMRDDEFLHEEKRPSFVRVGKSIHEEKRPSFVRVGKSLNEEKRPSFVRVGKSLHEEKRPSFVRVGKSFREEKRPSFVRVGKSFREEKRPSFVRVGKSLSVDKRPSFVRVGKSLIDEKRPSFVRVGKSLHEEKRPSFVRVGKSPSIDKRPSFVRVGKSEPGDIGDEDNVDLKSSLVGIERNCDKDRVKRQSFVRIGKSLRQAAPPPQSN